MALTLFFYFKPHDNRVIVSDLDGSKNNFQQLIKNFEYKINGELSDVMWQNKECLGYVNQPNIIKLENAKAIIYYFEGQVGENKIITKCITVPRYFHMLFYVHLKKDNNIKLIKTYSSEKEGPELKAALLKEYYE